MKSIKSHIKPLIFLLIIFGINTYLWLIRLNAAFMNNQSIITSLLGSTLLIGFALVFLLSTRSRLLLWIFGDLDVLYFWHRILSMASTAMIFVHASTSISNFQSFTTNIIILGTPANAGELARNGFLFLVVVALMAKFLKYEHFRFIHRFLIVPYIFALYHGFFSSWINLFSFDVLSIWMLTISTIGFGSSLYMIFFYQNTAFSHHGIIIEKNNLNDSMVELKVKMDDTYKFKPGQFAFIKIKARGISKAAHPFSISGSDDSHVFFTIKTLGDYTKALHDSLTVPAVIKMTRPYGNMTFKSKKKQVWIAGGIGVTPFLGYLRTKPDLDKDIHLYYSVNNASEAVHKEQLEVLAERGNFRFTLFEAKKMGYLSSKHLNLDNDTIVYMCGPRPMIMSLNKQIKTNHPGVEIKFEAFSFTGNLVDNIIRLWKNFRKKVKLVRKQV
mgnify:CR=1 FL=1